MGKKDQLLSPEGRHVVQQTAEVCHDAPDECIVGLTNLTVNADGRQRGNYEGRSNQNRGYMVSGLQRNPELTFAQVAT